MTLALGSGGWINLRLWIL